MFWISLLVKKVFECEVLEHNLGKFKEFLENMHLTTDWQNLISDLITAILVCFIYWKCIIPEFSMYDISRSSNFLLFKKDFV